MILSSIEPKTEQKYFTIEEYLALEETALEKHEYHDGEIIAMTGGTTNHNTLSIKFVFAFLSAFNNQDYQVYINDVKLFIEKYNRYTYPDVMIIKGKPLYEGESMTSVTNPLIIIEVLSKSTQNYDQTDKFDAYRSISHLQEYILIDQYQYYVKKFAKNEQEKWVLTDYWGKEATLKLECLPLDITLEKLYQRVIFNE